MFRKCKMQKKKSPMYVVRYGFDYENDNILGIYSSYHYAGKAKRLFERGEINKQMQYHYINIEFYQVDDFGDFS